MASMERDDEKAFFMLDALKLRYLRGSMYSIA
jgi:hypothetical protein